MRSETIELIPLEVIRRDCAQPCEGCGAPQLPGDLAAMTPDAMEFYCFDCITAAYEAMRAAMG